MWYFSMALSRLSSAAGPSLSFSALEEEDVEFTLKLSGGVSRVMSRDAFLARSI